ncbi:30S ribosomal protein S16 [Patescibacteria group bacterium]|nr:30S ribosomal protein S16 [Patescibacteria group bacterium]
MLAIRLRRTGKKGQPTYRIVVTDERASVYGKYIEMLGTFNPQTKAVTLNNEKTLGWLKNGAKPSNSVAKLLQKQKLEHPSILIKKYKAVSKTELEAQKAAEEKAKAEEATKKEAAKAAFEQQVEAEKAAAPKEDKLAEMAEESIAEVNEEEAAEYKEKPADTKEAPAETKTEEKDEKKTKDILEEKK